jgi:chloramphenicol O-acetyltransferase
MYWVCIFLEKVCLKNLLPCKGSHTFKLMLLMQRQELQQLQLLRYRKHSNMGSVFELTSVQTMFEIISKEEDKIKFNTKNDRSV